MPDLGARQSPRTANHIRAPRLLVPFAAVAGSLVAMVLIYFGYDLLSARLSPCETIFRQTAVNLSTKIRFLKAEGEVQIGKEPLIDLDERAQMAALNLKTCCVVLDAGKLNPEQFLQCKSKARAYESRIEDVVAAVQSVVASQAKVDAKHESGPTAAAKSESVKKEIKNDIQAARAISQDFNREIVEVRRTQALETLKAVPPRHVEIAAQELEPNDDVLSANVIELGKWITAAIASPKEADYFAFTTPPRFRDWIRIEVENRSTTLEPRIDLFDAAKASLGGTHQTTQGADVAHGFVGAPDTRYLFRISNYYGSSVGAYLVRAVATKAYDTYEPNEDILSARDIPLGSAVKAAIMDRRDVDFFRVESGAEDAEMLVEIRNESSSLRPKVDVFDAAKSGIGGRHNTTAGADVSHAFKVQPNTSYYLRVADYYSEAAGAYALTVTVK